MRRIDATGTLTPSTHKLLRLQIQNQLLHLALGWITGLKKLVALRFQAQAQALAVQAQVIAAQVRVVAARAQVLVVRAQVTAVRAQALVVKVRVIALLHHRA